MLWSSLCSRREADPLHVAYLAVHPPPHCVCDQQPKKVVELKCLLKQQRASLLYKWQTPNRTHCGEWSAPHTPAQCKVLCIIAVGDDPGRVSGSM